MKKIIIGLLAACAVMGPLRAECKIHKIKHVPYVITKPGKYLLCNDVTYTGSSSSDGIGAAIKIESSDVKLCLFAHSITVTDPTAYGIWVNKGATPEDLICEIDINNDAITGSAAAGINIDNACKVHLDNMYTIGGQDGLRITNSSDILVENSEFSKTSGIGCIAHGSQSITFKNCTWKEDTGGIILGGELKGTECKDTKILTCSFLNSSFSHIATFLSDGLLVKNSSFSQALFSDNMILIGTDPVPSNDTRFEGCSFISQGKGGYGFIFSAGTGLVIDSCLFHLSDAPADDTPYSNLLLSGASSNTLVTGSTFRGGSVSGRIGIDAQGPNVRIQSCLIDGFVTGISLESTGATVRSSRIVSSHASLNSQKGTGLDILGSSNSVENCSVINNDTGIVLEPGSHNNTISGNTVAQNLKNGIDCLFKMNDSHVPGPAQRNTISHNNVVKNGADGILVDKGCLSNIVERNITHSNFGFGIININDNDASNKFYFNTSFNNAPNYSSIISIPAQKNPGDKTVEGSNILPA